MDPVASSRVRPLRAPVAGACPSGSRGVGCSLCLPSGNPGELLIDDPDEGVQGLRAPDPAPVDEVGGGGACAVGEALGRIPSDPLGVGPRIEGCAEGADIQAELFGEALEERPAELPLMCEEEVVE